MLPWKICLMWMKWCSGGINKCAHVASLLMITALNGSIFRGTGPSWGGGFPHKGHWRRALIFYWSAPEQTVEQTMETPLIWDAIALIVTSLQCDSAMQDEHYQCHVTFYIDSLKSRAFKQFCVKSCPLINKICVPCMYWFEQNVVIMNVSIIINWLFNTS